MMNNIKLLFRLWSMSKEGFIYWMIYEVTERGQWKTNIIQNTSTLIMRGKLLACRGSDGEIIALSKEGGGFH